jgi:hypothetical protein
VCCVVTAWRRAVDAPGRRLGRAKGEYPFVLPPSRDACDHDAAGDRAYSNMPVSAIGSRSLAK